MSMDFIIRGLGGSEICFCDQNEDGIDFSSWHGRQVDTNSKQDYN